MRKKAYVYNEIIKRIIKFISSGPCFYLIVFFFVLEALWIALSGRYPMAFDENFHLGIIKLYAHHISPFWGGNPANSSPFGTVAHDPSYLYQWLMSFPYRISDNVIFLRIINIGLFAAGLPLYRRLLLKTGASRAITHLCMAFFVLIPIAPLLAAQINYDNLFFPMVALSLLLAIDFGEKLRRGSLDIKQLLILAIVAALTSLVKYAFLPIALAIVVYLFVVLWRTYRRNGKLLADIKSSWRHISVAGRWVLVTLVILSFSLFAQRYAVNLAKYHAPAPKCNQVLTIKECKTYGPWYRDYQYAHSKPANAQTSPLVFDADWFYGMWFRTFFAVDGLHTNFATRGPFVLPAVGALVFSALALIATALSWRQMMHRYNRRVIRLFIGVTASYVVALWLDGYRSFLHTGRPVALNGRYLLILYPMLMVILALGVNTYLKSRENLKAAIAVLALMCMFWGGGALTYILRSNDSWYWPNTPMKSANHAVQDVIGPIVPGNANPQAFMGHHGT